VRPLCNSRHGSNNRSCLIAAAERAERIEHRTVPTIIPAILALVVGALVGEVACTTSAALAFFALQQELSKCDGLRTPELAGIKVEGVHAVQQ
jgi:hypothetical protein